MKIDQKLIDEGYIDCKKHPQYDYYLYNYSFKTQMESYWNTQTIICRGLILDGQGNIIARPFNKFFNLCEYGQNTKLGKLPNYKSFEAFEKVDGSLIIAYKTPNNTFECATRGSFESDQAVKATRLLNLKYSSLLNHLDDNYTYLFEYISPYNRIVVFYPEPKLILLTAIHKKTGLDMPYEKLVALKNFVPVVKKFNSVKDFNKITEEFKYDNNEGFVIQFDTGLRVKIKYKEYIRQHKVVTSLNNKVIWEMLKNRQDFTNLLTNVPDEFYNWVLFVKEDLENKYEDIENQCFIILYLAKKDCITRKEFSLEFQKHKKLLGILFAMLDNKDYSEIIWKQVKPIRAFQPFKDKENI